MIYPMPDAEGLHTTTDCALEVEENSLHELRRYAKGFVSGNKDCMNPSEKNSQFKIKKTK
jgi:hypothetical protein